MLMNLRYTLRLLRKTPSFTTLSLVVITLGLSLFLATHSFTQLITDKPLPFPNGDRFVVFKQIEAEIGLDAFAPFYTEYQYNQIVERVNSYETIGAMLDQPLVISDGEIAQSVDGAELEPQLLQATGVSPLLGRIFTHEDLATGNNKVAVISEGLWKSYFAGDINVIGEVSRINGIDHTIIGVMPNGFHFPFSDQVWIPYDVAVGATPENSRSLAIIGVLKETTSAASATAELDAILRDLYKEDFDETTYSPPLIDHFASQQFSTKSNIGTSMLILTSVILGLAALNLGTLLFVRAQTRQKEMAIRSSIGANRWQTMRQTLLESLLLCCTGFVLSLLLTQLMLFAIEALIDSNSTPFWYQFTLPFNTIMTGAVATILVWFAASFVVAYRSSRKSPTLVLGSGGKGSTDASSSRVSSAIVGIEVTFSCFLLVFCLCFVASVVSFLRSDLGTNTDNFYAATIQLDTPQYKNLTARVNFLDTLKANVEGDIDLVDTLSFATLLPSEGVAWHGDFELPDHDIEKVTRQLSIWIDTDYFSTLGVDLIEGRLFDGGDNQNSQRVVIVNEEFAAEYWPGQSALGKTVTLFYYNGEKAEQFRIIGVIPAINQANLMKELVTPFYLPLTQESPSTLQLAIKTKPSINSGELENALKLSLASIDRDIALSNFGTLNDRVRNSLLGFDTLAQPFALVALITLIFSCIGIYGIIARNIALRTQAIGIRKALGSSNLKVMSIFLKQGLVYLSIGLVFGSGGASVFLLSVVTTLVPEIGQIVVGTLILVTTVMAALVFLASYLPSRKAIGMEPGDALRYE